MATIDYATKYSKFAEKPKELQARIDYWTPYQKYYAKQIENLTKQLEGIPDDEKMAAKKKKITDKLEKMKTKAGDIETRMKTLNDLLNPPPETPPEEPPEDIIPGEDGDNITVFGGDYSQTPSEPSSWEQMSTVKSRKGKGGTILTGPEGVTSAVERIVKRLSGRIG